MEQAQHDNQDGGLAGLFKRRPGCAQVFWRQGMLCPGCDFAGFCTLEDACREYWLDRVVLLSALMEFPLAPEIAQSTEEEPWQEK